MSQITRILSATDLGDRLAGVKLLPLVPDELRKVPKAKPTRSKYLPNRA
jgi:hypothetical protein